MNEPGKIRLTDLRIIVGVAVSLFILMPGLPYWQILGATLFASQVLALLDGLGDRIPVRAIFGTLFCLQFLIGPMIAYNFGDAYVIEIYQMRVPQEEYYSYVLPAAFIFILALNLNHKSYAGEVIDIPAVAELRRREPLLPFLLIGVGFGAGALEYFVGAELRFVFYLLGTLKYIGLFILILGDKKINLVPLGIILAYMVGVAMTTGMFHDLLTWLIFLGTVLFLKFRPRPVIKFAILFGFGLMSVTIQFIKSDYRQTLSSNSEVGYETFGTVYSQVSQEKGSMFSEANIALNSVRINQGYIIGHIMYNVPYNEPYAEGETLKRILLSAFLPRLVYPDKLNAGDQQIFMQYTGLQLNRTTAMALSSVGDAYINFGKYGAWIFMFFYGLLFNMTLKFLAHRARNLPILLLFIPMIFVFPIRPDCEMQTILGHLVKSTFLVLVVLYFFRKKFVTARRWAAQ